MSNSTPNPTGPAITLEEVGMVAPELEKLTRDLLVNGLWKRSELSARDRSLITLSAFIARNQTVGMVHYLNLALDSGVTPAEISEMITHLAFYSGWPNAFAVIAIVRQVYTQRGLGLDR
jgi:4-carboxymuconolactone decarboxylase